jgi:hypothetical protein
VNTHVYIPDPLVVGPLGDQVCATCGMPALNRVHDVPDVSDAQAEQRRWIGEER